MTSAFGLLAAFIAFLAWGFGDFAIQRSVRKVGAIPALFFIGLFAGFGLLPFVWHDIPLIWHSQTIAWLLVVTGVVTFVYAVFLFQSLNLGKLSIVEPIMSFELPLTVALSVLFIHEKLTSVQFILGVLIFLGLVVTVVRREPRHWWNFFRRHVRIEHGVLLAGIAVLFSASANVLTGVSSQEAKPVLAIWFISTTFGILCLIWMILQKQVRTSFQLAFHHWRPVVLQGILDNGAWIAFAFAVRALPISITIAITESYIALAALLGIVLNKERLQRHQYIGITITLVMAIVLAVVSER